MSKKTLKTLRTRSFHAQSGCCYYCGAPMWLANLGELSLRSRAYQCTAEHLLARQNGGKDVASNIVAACHLCNLRRYQRPSPAPSAEIYRAKVRRQVAKGKWHSSGLRTAMTGAAERDATTDELASHPRKHK